MRTSNLLYGPTLVLCTGALLASSLVLGCGSDDPSTDQGEPPTVTLTASCINTFDLDKLTLQPGQDDVLFGSNDVGLYRSTDGGQTFDRFYRPELFDVFDPDRALRPFVWQRYYPIDAERQIIEANGLGVGWPPMLAFTEDAGATWSTAKSTDEITYQGETVAQWKLADGDYLFQYHNGYYRTKDSGATAERLVGGVAPGTLALARQGDRLIFRNDPYVLDQQLPATYSTDGGATTTSICPPADFTRQVIDDCRNDPGADCNADFIQNYYHGCMPADVAALGPDQAYAISFGIRVLWTPDGNTWHFYRLPRADREIKSILGLHFIGSDLYINAQSTPIPNPLEPRLYRIRDALTSNWSAERVVLNAGDRKIEQLASPVLLGGRTRFVAAVEPGKDTFEHVLCEMGDGVSSSYVPLETGTPQDPEPGRMYIHARRARTSQMFDRMSIRDDGNVFISSWRKVLSRVPPADPLFGIEDNFGDNAWLVGISTAQGLKAFINDFGASTVQPELYVLDLDPLFGAPLTQTTFHAQREGIIDAPIDFVYSITSVDTDTLVGTKFGTWPLRAQNWSTSFPRQPLPGIAWATPNGVALYKHSINPQQGITAIGLTRLDRGKADDGSCPAIDPVESPSCLFYEGEATSMAMDRAGYVYVVDGPRGVVARRKPDDSAWTTVAEGLMHPADIRIREEGGHTLAYVLDGDVWVFEPGATPARRKPPQGQSYATSLRDPAEDAGPLPPLADRPLAQCDPNGPCISPPQWSNSSFPWKDLDGTFVLIDQTLCMPGQGYGTNGTLHIGPNVIPTSTWNEANVCFDASQVPREPSRGALWLVRSDGVASQAVPYIVDPQNTHGKYGYSVEQSLPPSSLGMQILETCRSGPNEPCGVLVYHANSQPIVTIDGQPTTILSQNGARFQLAWPAGLAPGIHTLDFDGLQADVELIDVDKNILGNIYPDRIGVVDHGQGIAQAFGRTFAIIRQASFRSASGMKVPDTVIMQFVDVTGQSAPPFPDDQMAFEEDAPRIINHEGNIVAAVRRASYQRLTSSGGTTILDYKLVTPVTAGFFELVDNGGTLMWQSWPDLPIPNAADNGNLVALSSALGRVWVGLHDSTSNTLFILARNGTTWEEAGQMQVSSPRVVVAGDRWYLSSASGVVPVQLTIPVPGGAPVADISASVSWPGGEVVTTGPVDDGLLAVSEAAPNATVFRLAAGSTAFAPVGDLPNLPGLFERTKRVSDGVDMPGVSAVFGAGTDTWVAVASRQGSDQGLRVTHFDGTSWTTTSEFASTKGGEMACVGPILTDQESQLYCSGFIGAAMSDGCTLYACQVGVGGWVARGGRPERVALWVGPNAVHLTFDAIFGNLGDFGRDETQSAHFPR